jgi:hypothetical protein
MVYLCSFARRMKGSPVDSRLIMDSLLFNLMRHELLEEHNQ